MLNKAPIQKLNAKHTISQWPLILLHLLILSNVKLSVETLVLLSETITIDNLGRKPQLWKINAVANSKVFDILYRCEIVEEERTEIGKV